MTEAELNLLHTKLKKSRRYLEYGSGKSTEFAASLENLEFIVSVESDQAFWNERVSPNPEVSKAVEDGRLKVIFPDLGKTGDWGVPTSEERKFLWPNYSLSPHNERDYDLVLVDGRFRVACILASVLALPETEVLVHDFWQRKKYHVVLNHCEVEEDADTMVCLRRKKNFDADQVSRLLVKYLYNPIDSTKTQRMIRDVCFKTIGREKTIQLIQKKKSN